MTEREKDRDDIVLEQMVADNDGWSDWIHPLPGYKMGCCDCGLVHDMEFAIVPSSDIETDGELNEGESRDAVIIFRAARAESHL